MKHPAGYAPSRRPAKPKRQVRLDLRRRPEPEPEDEVAAGRKSHFGRWVALVALLHLLVIAAAYWIYEASAKPKPQEQFMSLLPPGDVVKGTPGIQAAPKLGPTTPAPSVHHSSTTPPKPAPKVPAESVTPKPAAVHPPKPKPPTVVADKPTPQPPPKPKPPTVKVDLNVVDGPTSEVDKPVVKPKPHHVKKPVVATPPDDSNEPDSDTASHPNNSGLSREQIAAKLGENLDAPGVKSAVKSGTSGSANSQANRFAEFDAALRDQVMSQWAQPNLNDPTAINPIVEIHVEKDGRVPPESVHLIQSSGNPAYDDSAVTAAKTLGYLHEPLPVGRPPDIPITFKLTR